MALDRLPSIDFARFVTSTGLVQTSTMDRKYYRARGCRPIQFVYIATYLPMTRDTLCNECWSARGRCDINFATVLCADQFNTLNRLNGDKLFSQYEIMQSLSLKVRYENFNTVHTNHRKYITSLIYKKNMKLIIRSFRYILQSRERGFWSIPECPCAHGRPWILPHELSLRVRIDLYNPSYCWLKGIGARPSCFSVRSHLLRCSSKTKNTRTGKGYIQTITDNAHFTHTLSMRLGIPFTMITTLLLNVYVLLKCMKIIVVTKYFS